MNSPDGRVAHLPAEQARLTFERHYAADVGQVWAALTDPDRMRQWWAEAPRLDLREGGEFVLNWLNSDDEGFHPVARGRIAALDAPRLIEYDTDIFGVLRFLLVPAGEGTDLAFTATLPLQPAWEAKMLAGWHWRFDALARALGGQPVDWEHWPLQEWVAARKRYADKLSWGG